MNGERIIKTAVAGVKLAGEVLTNPTKYLEGVPTEIEYARLEQCQNCNIRTGNQCDPTKCTVVDGKITCGCGCYIPVAVTRANKECPIGRWGVYNA